MDLYFATSNMKKYEEAKRIVPSLKRIGVEVPEIQSIDTGEVVAEKALAAYAAVKKPVVVDDTGLYIDAWNGFPGALGKWLIAKVGAEGVCRMMSAYAKRSATAETRLALYDGKRLRIFTGRARGRIAYKPAGAPFGFDPIFIPFSFSRTYGEMNLAEKNKVSARGRAFLKLRKFLSEA